MDTNYVINEKIAMDIVSKLTGPKGILAVAEQTVKTVSQLKQQRAKLDSQILGYQILIDTLKRLAIQWGIDDLKIEEPIRKPARPDPGKEITERVVKGLCIYKDQDTRKWCQRRLKTKREKETGYCSACQVRLGLAQKRGPKSKEK